MEQRETSFFRENFMIEFTTFSGSMFCSEEKLLNWLNKRTELVEGAFKSTELFLLKISMSLLLSTEKEKSFCQISKW